MRYLAETKVRKNVIPKSVEKTFLKNLKLRVIGKLLYEEIPEEEIDNIFNIKVVEQDEIIIIKASLNLQA